MTSTEEERKAAAEKVEIPYEWAIDLQIQLTRKEAECQSLMRTINHLAGGAAQGMLAHAKLNPPAEENSPR